jgi:cob(I)alamin adenosyltransferase
MKGYIQVYTGNGKGKTTAAFGLVLRAAGAGLKVYIAQFVKGIVKQYGMSCFIYREPKKEDIRTAQEGLREVKEIMCFGKFQMIILDEANIATPIIISSP